MSPESKTGDLLRNYRIAKILHHIQEALIHIDQSELPEHTKVELDGLLDHASQVLTEAVEP